MTRSIRKFIAVIMLLWLPIFTGNALAASVSMLLSQGECHEAAMSHEAMNMGMDMGELQHHGNMPAPADEHSSSCNDCGLCHLACTGYLAVPSTEVVAAQATELETTPYLVVFHSHTSAPLVPPPLARA
jgi:hypothetical protein